MKKQIYMISIVFSVILLFVGGVAAQADKKMDKDMKMDMMAMQNSPQHLVMMAYQQNVLTFAKSLRDMTASGKLEDVELARSAFAEIKRSMEKMDGIHKDHMSKMSADKLEMMKPMMAKMEVDKTLMNEHILALEKALQAATPVATDVNAHAGALVMQLEKMNKPDKKMKM